ncbi:MAG: cupin domain-containing protein [Phycisphaerales bacterium]|nr:cupin domain-containing protein [Phycisphaerales bacterium]
MGTPLLDGTRPELVELLATCPIVAGATVSRALLNTPDGRVIVFAMDAGQEMSEHRAPFMASVQVLDGRLSFGVDGKDREMRANDWLIMPPNAPHRLLAIEPTRFVLTLFKRGS